MKILLLAPFPYGKSSAQGGSTACANALTALVQQHQVYILCFSRLNSYELAALDEMQLLARKVKVVKQQISKSRVLWAKLISLVSSKPEHVCYFESASFRTALKSFLQEIEPDLVITQFPQMAQYLPYCGTLPTVHDVQDAFSVSAYRRTRTAAPGLKHWYATKQWRNWVAYESHYYSQANQCWTLSEQDRYGLTVFTPNLNVVCLGLPLTDKLQPVGHDGINKVGFIASFGHAPNIEAVQYLMRQIAPQVLARLPEVVFLIAGRNPPANLVKSAPTNVKFVGYVESLSDFYAECQLVIAPLVSGGGVKIKVAEALCYGKAVITTPIGAEGIPIINRQSAIIESDPTKLAHAVCELMDSPATRHAIASQGFALAEQTFSISGWSERANRQLEELLAHAGATRSS